ncbi:hypothetical protein N7528_006667 [Penicillium herquei]|nr:hypothetical protein N7528_006667 [Penicillium herquei]
MHHALPSTMKPSLGGIWYDSLDWEQLPATPILSILQFKFSSDVNLENTSQAVSVLWQKSVEFVSTLPGFQGLYWAPVSQMAVIALIQWDSGLAWGRFQCSLGFSMLLGYLEDITNRCVQHALPDYLSSTGFCLEVFSYGFAATNDAPTQRQSNFKERWNSSLQLHKMDNMLYAFGDWIEDDDESYTRIPRTSNLPLMKEGFKVDDHYFAGLLFWKTCDTDLEMPSKIANQFATLGKEANTAFIPKTKQMRYEGPNASFKLQKAKSCPLPNQPTWDYPLLNTSVSRRYDLEDSVRLAYLDTVHLESMKASCEHSNKRVVPSPAGTWNRMGAMTQYGLPEMFSQRTRESQTVLEVISFRLLHQSPHFDKLFGDFRLAIWRLQNRPGVKVAYDHNDPTRVFLLAGMYP